MNLHDQGPDGLTRLEWALIIVLMLTVAGFCVWGSMMGRSPW